MSQQVSVACRRDVEYLKCQSTVNRFYSTWIWICVKKCGTFLCRTFDAFEHLARTRWMGPLRSMGVTSYAIICVGIVPLMIERIQDWSKCLPGGIFCALL